VTYDRVLQFYNVKASIAQPQMMVMTDVNDVFVPMTDGFLVGLEEARTVLERWVSGGREGDMEYTQPGGSRKQGSTCKIFKLYWWR